MVSAYITPDKLFTLRKQRRRKVTKWLSQVLAVLPIYRVWSRQNFSPCIGRTGQKFDVDGVDSLYSIVQVPGIPVRNLSDWSAGAANGQVY